jgi:carbonic anhydrase
MTHRYTRVDAIVTPLSTLCFPVSHNEGAVSYGHFHPSHPTMLLAILTLLATGLTVNASCAHGTTLHPFELATVAVSTFSYDGVTGPWAWYGLDATANMMCGEGTSQSPIVITDSTATSPGNFILFDIPDVRAAKFENLGTNVEVVVNGTISVSGKDYSVQQFHIHTP